MLPPNRRADLADLLHQALHHHGAGDLGRAEALYLKVLAGLPQQPVASCNLAAILAETGRPREAQRQLEKLLKASPDMAAAHALTARLLRHEDKATRALFHFRRALALDPDDMSIWLDTIAALGKLGRVDEAETTAAAANARFAQVPEIATQFDLVLLHNGRRAAARAAFAQALDRDPHCALALYNPATLHDDAWDIGEALRLYRRAVAADHAKQLPAINLGDLELRLGDVDAAIAGNNAWLDRHPADPGVISNRLMAAQYVPGVTAAQLRKLYDHLWQDRVAALAAPAVLRHPIDRDPDRRLRVGLVSGDLRAHPVGQFTVRGIEALDTAEIEVAAYTGVPDGSATEARFRARANIWRDVSGWSDTKLAETIAQYEIDILIDMAGHTTNIRLGAFAHKPAPVQLSWAGYFGTTGAAAIDGLIADRHLVPNHEDGAYREEVLRLPDGYLCYDPPSAPDVTHSHGGTALKLAAFHHPAKINQPLVQLWARVLQEACGPGASLHLVYAGFEQPEVQARITTWFTAAGIAAGQLHFTGALPPDAYLAHLGEMDIGLDPRPYSGGAITCDALWMGLPVVTWPGLSFAERHTQSHLNAAGLAEFVARDANAYVAIVAKLARDPALLATWRTALRERLAQSALCDGPRFGANLLTLLRGCWQHHCRLSTALS